MTYKEMDITDNEDLSIIDIELDSDIDESELPELEDVPEDEMVTEDRKPKFFSLPFKDKNGKTQQTRDIKFKGKRIGSSGSFLLRRFTIRNVSAPGVDIIMAVKLGKNKFGKEKIIRPSGTTRLKVKRSVVVRFGLVNQPSTAKFSIDVK